MKSAFKIALKFYKYLLLLFIIGFWVYIIIDDWVFIEKYWTENWLSYLTGWMIWCLIYSVMLSIYFWGIIASLIFIYHKLVKRKTIS